MTTLNKYALLVFTALILLFSSCSVERKNPLSKAYHNTTAHYNGYFLGREKMNAVEKAVQDKMVYDYSQVLPLYPVLDSVTAKAAAADLEDVVKKASFPIQWHKNSKWIDECYLLIGKARFYQLDFNDAAKTFKFVNTSSPDKDTQHEALVWLMRTFLKLEEMDNAQSVSEYLRKERLNKANARELYLARAQYHRILGDTTAVIQNLALSIPNFEEKDAESRARFTLAQLYEATKQDKEAYQHYSAILKRNPPYDLGFFSRLNLGQVTELTNNQDMERIAGYYQRLLKDEKNKEYRDKIYYEMAQFEFRQKQYDQGLAYLKQSLKTPGALPNQRAYSYCLAGEVYFENLNKYDLAEAYYDSAVQVYPQQAQDFEVVQERRTILGEFVQNYTTIQTQDSLQRLAKLSEAERMALVQQLVQREDSVQQAFTAQQLQQQNTPQRRSSTLANRNGDAFATAANSTGVFYFDNPTAMASARSEFQRRWGNRPSQDFWRTRIRGEATQQTPIAQAEQTEPTDTVQVSPEARMQAQVQAYLQNIPLSTADLQRSEKQVEEALFNLGNIYSQKLKDPAKATKTFEELLRRFPNTEHAAETSYSLYLLYARNDEAQKQAYYTKIKQQYPSSIYARLVDDPAYMSKNALENLDAHILYDSAYTYYEAQDYQKATALLNKVASLYPLNDIPDKIAYLEAMLVARTQKPEMLRQQLLRFQNQYPNSTLLPKVNTLLASYTSLEERNQLRDQAPPKPAPMQQPTAALTPEEKVNQQLAASATSTPKPQPAAEKTTPNQPLPATAEVTPAQQPAETISEELPEAPSSETVAAEEPATIEDELAYQATPDSAYYFVMIYPTDAPAFKEVQPKYTKYNNTYFRAQNLQVESVAFAEGKTMLVMRAFTDLKVAQSFRIKQMTAQAPVGRIRGVEFTTFVISSANYQKFMQKKDVETYLAFFKNNY
ncbi:hypothetical protein DP923_05055 [Pontibacter arcticus]|uniref:Tetratricopeptide repeat-containing protein n=1 Tax=Pontibacter arcticus TaxID=2080288 RepID=A0A364RJU1_9BACT|nr:hypothetical protein DP923_05055 [Pontibacter arcticus]